MNVNVQLTRMLADLLKARLLSPDTGASDSRIGVSEDRRMPIASLESFSSTPWASATFEGHRHHFSIAIKGAEDDVDRLAAQIEADLKADEIAPAGMAFLDVVRTDTAKIVDGEGGAGAVLSFEGLTVAD